MNSKLKIALLTCACIGMGAAACAKAPRAGEIRKVDFKSDGVTLRGNLHYPADYRAGKQYPAIIVTGSWTTVKEQMAGLYARKFARDGFIALAFDFRNFGESGGEPRFYEAPRLKVRDIRNAVTYLQSVRAVRADEIGAFAVCASAGYALEAAAGDKRIRAIAVAAAWLHDAQAVKLFYGGEKGVQQRLAAARAAKKEYKASERVEYIPTISTTDKSAAMYGPYDYYLNPKRGAVKEWSNDKFAVMSWEDWLTYDPMPSAARLDTPTLMIHADGAVLPGNARKYFARIKTSKKKLHWIKSGKKPPFEQFDFYDKAETVDLSVNLASRWYERHLGAK